MLGFIQLIMPSDQQGERPCMPAKPTIVLRRTDPGRYEIGAGGNVRDSSRTLGLALTRPDQHHGLVEL